MYLTDSEHKKEKLPFFIRVFHKTFGVELDILLSAIACVIAFIVLALGVMHSIQMGASLVPFAEYADAKRVFWLLILTFVIPVSFVALGRDLVGRMNKFVAECEDEIAQIYEDKISDLVLPDSEQAPAGET